MPLQSDPHQSVCPVQVRFGQSRADGRQLRGSLHTEVATRDSNDEANSRLRLGKLTKLKGKFHGLFRHIADGARHVGEVSCPDDGVPLSKEVE